MAENEKIRVSTLDEWHAALAKMYSALKNENADRYITDVGKDYESSSGLTSGVKAKAEHINNLISNINNLNGKDPAGNIPIDKDNLKVYFWYSNWNSPPGEITIGDTKIKIQSQLKQSIDNTISELKQICVNNSKEKLLFDSVESRSQAYICEVWSQECFDNSTISHATIPSNSQTSHATAYDSKTVKNTIGTVTTSNSNTPNATVKKITSNSVKPKDNKECKYNSNKADAKETWNYNCSQYGITCVQNITNANWYTEGKRHGFDKESYNVKNTKYGKSKGYTKDAVKTNSVKPGNTKISTETRNSTKAYDSIKSYATKVKDEITVNSTTVSYSKDTGDSNFLNSKEMGCNQCSQDVRCQTYNTGYSVKKNEDGTFKTVNFINSDSNFKLDHYLYIEEK